ncbi:CHASE domain-containing protein, partial [uncultured Thiocystis sp.]|uniref:CHASE domain-containing protein n=1 Tax=uncultured Thiocystis sp. TaxID=1202134 RepID=UPI0025FB7E73
MDQPRTVLDRLAHFRPPWPVWVTLIVGLALTTLGSVHTHSQVESENRQALATIGAEIAQKIKTRLHAHALVLRDAAAFLRVSGELDRARWRDYIAQAQIHLNLPGVQGIGVARLIPPDRLAEHEREIRGEGFPDYRVWPQGERPLYSAIVYLEPFAGRNLHAFGYDMLTEPVRRAAMERARDQDVVALSGKVRLVQETDTDVQAGVLMYVPVYRPGLPTETVDQRRAALLAWVYSPFRMNDLMHGVLGNGERDGGKHIRLAIYDGDRVTPAALLYDSQTAGQQAPAPASANALHIPIDFNGQRWTLSFSQVGRSAFAQDDVRVSLIAGSGIVISVLLAALVGAFLRARRHARRLAAELAARRQAEQELREAEGRYRDLFESSPVGLYRSTPQGRYLDVNTAFARILGYASPQQLMAEIADIAAQLYANPREREVLAGLIAERGQVLGFEIEARRRDGQPVWISADVSAVRDTAGAVVAYQGAMTDITERVRDTLVRDTVSAVARLAVSSVSADGFRQALPALLSTRLGYPIVAVETYDAVRGDMVFAGVVGISAAADGRLRVPVGETLSGQVATRGEALVETAADTRPEYAFAALRALGVVTFVCVPMALGTRMLGTLALADRRRRPDAAWLVDMLRTVADTAADAIERLENQAALRERERDYRGLVDNLNAGVVVHAPDTRIRFSNPMASQLLGLDAPQMQGLAAVAPAWRFVRDDGTPMPQEEYPVERVAASGDPLQNLILGIRRADRDDPTWVQCAAHPLRDDQGQLEQIVVTFFDVSQLVRAERALKESREWLQKNRDLLNAMGRMALVGGWEIDVETGQNVWTEAIFDIHELDQGYMPTMEQGIAYYAPESRPIISEAVRRAIDLGEPYDLELEIVTAKGHRRWVHTMGRAVREGGRTITISGTFQDITERKHAEMELDQHRHQLEALVEARTQALNEQLVRVREQDHLLLHQARLAAMGEMLGNIAHQWRQPLSALALVLGNLQDAEQHQELTPQYLAQKIADAHRLIDKMSTTISDFRDFFRPDKPSETFDLSQPVG